MSFWWTCNDQLDDTGPLHCAQCEVHLQANGKVDLTGAKLVLTVKAQRVKFVKKVEEVAKGFDQTLAQRLGNGLSGMSRGTEPQTDIRW